VRSGRIRILLPRMARALAPALVVVARLAVAQQVPMLPASGDPWATRAIDADAADGDLQRLGARVFPACASCHLADAGGRPDGAIPRLAGQSAGIIASKLKRIRRGEVFLPVMAAFANSLGERDVEGVAAYLAALPTPAYLGHGPGSALARGRAVYAAACVACHGVRGEGNAALRAPRLCGQHYGYTLRRVGEIAERQRGDSDAAMAAVVSTLTKDDLSAVADQLSRMNCEASTEGQDP